MLNIHTVCNDLMTCALYPKLAFLFIIFIYCQSGCRVDKSTFWLPSSIIRDTNIFLADARDIWMELESKCKETKVCIDNPGQQMITFWHIKLDDGNRFVLLINFWTVVKSWEFKLSRGESKPNISISTRMLSIGNSGINSVRSFNNLMRWTS
jgi:hypothetical protein